MRRTNKRLNAILLCAVEVLELPDPDQRQPMIPPHARRLIGCQKQQDGPATLWSSDPLPPRYSASPKARPMPRGTEWRSACAIHGELVFFVTTIVQPAFANWQALLILQGSDGRRALARWEEHADHAGIHAHAWCDGRPVPSGALSLDAPVRLPATRRHHRRTGLLWTKDSFWVAACRRFGVIGESVNQGRLF